MTERLGSVHRGTKNKIWARNFADIAMLGRSCRSRPQVMHRRPVDNVDSGVRSLKKMHGVLSRARLVRSRVLRIRTGAPASWVVVVLSQLRNQLVHRPAAPRVDPQGAAGILPKSSDERKRGEAFPQSRLVGETKQSHLTCASARKRGPLFDDAAVPAAPGGRPAESFLL